MRSNVLQSYMSVRAALWFNFVQFGYVVCVSLVNVLVNVWLYALGLNNRCRPLVAWVINLLFHSWIILREFADFFSPQNFPNQYTSIIIDYFFFVTTVLGCIYRQRQSILKRNLFFILAIKQTLNERKKRLPRNCRSAILLWTVKKFHEFHIGEIRPEFIWHNGELFTGKILYLFFCFHWNITIGINASHQIVNLKKISFYRLLIIFA